ncbi:hypothetical protein ACHHYP_20144 [Achlya hypogyna]|uniref:DUF1772 domain-containing protein n=1 Tax=Achlya hypogyna TaxID=1202772 RepID=A0A1V9Z325_ACHHY|nr:hypothetical protein ACHHYP_20144 [Achlya hypogyna]
MLQAVAVGACGLYAGAAAYITLVQHPSLLRLEDHRVQAAFFADMYGLAGRFMAPLHVLGSVAAVSVWVLDRSQKLFLVGGLIMGSILPFTTFAMLRLNNDLRRCGHRRKPSWLVTKLRRWGHLHAVRSALSASATATLLAALHL